MNIGTHSQYNFLATIIHILGGVRLSLSGSYLPPPRGGGGGRAAALPVNNGTEGPGRCVVIDFESDLFVGTAMMRIKNDRAPPPRWSPDGDANDPTAVDGDVDADDGGTSSGSYYFHDKKRTFQGVVRGRFKLRGVPMSECVTGQVFHRPAGRMPPRFVVRGAMSIIRNLAPQLQASLDCDRPRFLSPLVSTAQTASSRSRRGRACGTGPDGGGGGGDDDDDESADGRGGSIEAAMEEPQPSDPSSLLRELLLPRPDSVGRSFELPADSDRVARRVKARKRAFDGLRARGDASPTFDPDREYTFEFFQHLLLFDEFALDLPRPVGKRPLRRMLDGQPLKFMAAHQVVRDGAGGIGPTGTKAIDEEMRWLWSFDLWHESLYEDAIDRSEECTQCN